MDEKVIIIFERMKTNECFDIEVPLNITVNELLHGLNEGLHLGLDLEDSSQCFLSIENPIALLKGNHLLSEYSIHNGTKISFNR